MFFVLFLFLIATTKTIIPKITRIPTISPMISPLLIVLVGCVQVLVSEGLPVVVPQLFVSVQVLDLVSEEYASGFSLDSVATSQNCLDRTEWHTSH